MKPFVDPVTFSKVVVINGDVSKGTPNDKILTELIGEEWRDMTGAESPRLRSDSAPGYDHAANWAVVKAEYAKRVAADKLLHNGIPAATAGAATADASAAAAAIVPPTPPETTAEVRM